MAFLEFKEISKRFPGVQALDQVSFAVEAGSCHALIGENGAGKSTIGKILAGVYRPDAGEMWLGGERIEPHTPLAARRLGIAMVHQELAFCPNMTIAENLCLGDLPRSGGWLNKREMRERAAAMLAEVGAEFDPGAPIAELTTGQEQMVQIAAALGSNARIIIMDEPTSSLSARESEHLFALIERLRTLRMTIIYVSHRMEEIFQLCDTITVLRDGRHVSTENAAQTNPDRVIHQMVGREVIFQLQRHLEKNPGAEMLRVDGLASVGRFEGINFTLRAGEVLGLAGLIGAGRSEVAQAIFGLDPQARGEVRIEGQPLPLGKARQSMAAGIGFLPEDRKRLGLILTMTCKENSSLVALPSLVKAGFIQASKERDLAARYMTLLRVKAPSLESPVAVLSGGNQQKIALAKWLASNCRILIIDEPTRGVDVGAKAEIHQLIDDLACQGLAVLLISSELPELMNLSRRIIVLREGRITAEFARDNFSQPDLMRAMAGLAVG